MADWMLQAEQGAVNVFARLWSVPAGCGNPLSEDVGPLWETLVSKCVCDLQSFVPLVGGDSATLLAVSIGGAFRPENGTSDALHKTSMLACTYQM